MIGAGAFPAPIAGAMQAWEAETNDLFRRQARLIACFEALIQYAAIVAVSEFHRAGLDREFPDIDALIRDVIHRPSTGTWQRIYREAAGAFRDRRAALACDGIYRFGFDDGGRQQPWMRAAEELTQFRNEQKGHGHVLSEHEYRPLLEKYEAKLRELLVAAEFARELTLCVVVERSPAGVVAGRLMGPVESAGPRDEFPAAEDAPPPGHVAARHAESGRWIDLSPLLLYLECEREVERVDARGQRSRDRCGRPGVFFHHELLPPSRVRGFEFRYSHHSSWRFPDFDFVGLYLERYGRRAVPGSEAEWYQTRITEATRYFVGRKEPLDQLTRLARGESTHRVAFVVALPGFGKSTLLARWIAQVDRSPGGTSVLHVARHFIQEPYPESGRASNIFDILRLQVCDRFGLDSKPPYPDGRSRAARYRAALLESIAVAVKAAGQPRIALVIDGLDEALRVTAGEDEAILDWLPGPDLLPPGVTLVLSGRPNVAEKSVFQSRFGRRTTEYIQLSRLADSEVREWFVLAFGPVYALEQQPFLDRVAAVAKGHPQYLHFVHRALMDGTLLSGDPATLPAELEEFYARVMQEAAGAQPMTLRVIALLAAAAAPLDLTTMAAVLGDTVDNVAMACDAARNVLEWDPSGRVLLFDAEFAEWVRGGTMRGGSADALRRETYAAMSTRLLDWCRDWRTHRSAYAATNLVAHLVAAGRHDEVRALARTAEFLDFQASARPDAPDLPQAMFRQTLHHAAQVGDHPAIAEFGLRRVAWATATLAESPEEAYRSGAPARARRLADLHEPVERLSWYFILAHRIMEKEGAAAAEQFLGLPARLPWWPATGAARGTDLTQVADVLIRLHPLPRYDLLWRLYLDEAARSRLAANLVTFDRLDLAQQIVKEIPASPHRDRPLIKLAERAATAGDLERAYRFVDGMWLSESRWVARELIVGAAAPSQGLAIVESAEREASRDPRARDALVRKIALAFARAGKAADASIAAGRIEYAVIRDSTFGSLALDALDRRDIAEATRCVARITPGNPLGRTLLDRAGLAALQRLRIADLARVVGADPIAKRLGRWLLGLTALVWAAAMLLARVPGLARLAPLWPVVLLVGAFAIVMGLRNGGWRASISALAWGTLTVLSLAALSAAQVGPIALALLAAGGALLVSAMVFGLSRLTTRLLPRIATVALVSGVVAAVLTSFAGTRFVAFASEWFQFALLFPAGAAIAVAAFGSVTSPEERLAYHAGALLPGLIMLALGMPAAAMLPNLMLVGWTMAGASCLVLPVLRRLRIPGRPALFMAAAELWRSFMALSPATEKQSPIGIIVSLLIVVFLVAVFRRQKATQQPTAEDHAANERTRPRSLLDLTRNPAERKARFNAELLLRLARLFPERSAPVARDAARAAATAASAMADHGEDLDPIEEPVRRDLLWQVARESWRRRDLAGWARAAWRVEWRRWSGMIACASAAATGLLIGTFLRWILVQELGRDPASLKWLAILVASTVGVLAATAKLRSLREPLLAAPLTVMAAAWTVWGPVGLTRIIPLVLTILLCVAIGAPGSGSVMGWAASLGLVWRWQVALATPAAMLAVGAVTLLGGTPWTRAQNIVLRPTAAVVMVGLLTFVLDAAARRAAMRVLAVRAKDLPPLAAPDGEGIAVFERATFSDDVGAAVVRLAEREPAALEGIARAAMRVSQDYRRKGLERRSAPIVVAGP